MSLGKLPFREVNGLSLGTEAERGICGDGARETEDGGDPGSVL